MKPIKVYIAFNKNKYINDKALVDTIMQVVNLFSISGVLAEYHYVTRRDVNSLSDTALFAYASMMLPLDSFSDNGYASTPEEPYFELCILFEKSIGFSHELYFEMYNEKFVPPTVYSFQKVKVYSVESLIEDYNFTDSIIGAEIYKD